MRCSVLSSMWLLATASFALPSGDYSSHASNPGVKRASEPAHQSFENWYTETATAPQLDERASEPFENWYTEKAAAPPLDKRAPAGPPAGKGVYTKAEWPWLEKKAAADATVDGLKNTTATLVDMFGKAKMPWIVSGGWALILYGQPNRKTTDMDIVIQTTMPNLKKLLAADPRFYVGAPGTWPDTEYLQVFFKNQDKFFDIDMIIAGKSCSFFCFFTARQIENQSNNMSRQQRVGKRVGSRHQSDLYDIQQRKALRPCHRDWSTFHVKGPRIGQCKAKQGRAGRCRYQLPGRDLPQGFDRHVNQVGFGDAESRGELLHQAQIEVA